MNTEYMIMHEGDIDWEKLSKDSSRSLSLAEIRMFRKRINWCEYIKTHDMSPDGLEIASKHFRQEEYNLIALLNYGLDDFILNHREKFDWLVLFGSHYLKPSTIMACIDCWKDIPPHQIEAALIDNPYIDPYNGEYDELLLYLGIKNPNHE